MALTFCVCSDAYLAGRTEDGLDYTAEVFYVVAEDADGNRWRHHARFRGCVVEYSDEGEGPFFIDIRKEAEALAQRIVDRIHAAGGAVDLDNHWHTDRPAYASRAYQAYGQFDDWMEDEMERRGFH